MAGLGFMSDWFGSSEPKIDNAEIARAAKAEADYQAASQDLKGYENKMAFANRMGKPKENQATFNSQELNELSKINWKSDLIQQANDDMVKRERNLLKNGVKPFDYSQNKEPVTNNGNIQRTGERDLIAEAYAANKYNKDNKYRVGGLNLSNRTGDAIGDFFSRLF